MALNPTSVMIHSEAKCALGQGHSCLWYDFRLAPIHRFWQATRQQRTIAGHEALQAYCRSLNKLVELLGEQVEEIRVIHREELVKNPSLQCISWRK